jgi:hypothetical protein
MFSNNEVPWSSEGTKSSVCPVFPQRALQSVGAPRNGIFGNCCIFGLNWPNWCYKANQRATYL